MNNKDIIQQIEDSIQIKKHIILEATHIEVVSNIIVNAFATGKKVVIFGNGGSAADAQHIAAEFAGKFYIDRDPLPAIALNTNASVLTAIANDYDYDSIFSRQVKSLVQNGDIVIGISTSGNSRNVILAIEEANNLNAITIAFTGNGGKLSSIANHSFVVPSKDTPRIQEAHILIGHLICYKVEQVIFGKKE